MKFGDGAQCLQHYVGQVEETAQGTAQSNITESSSCRKGITLGRRAAGEERTRSAEGETEARRSFGQAGDGQDQKTTERETRKRKVGPTVVRYQDITCNSCKNIKHKRMSS